MDSIEAAKEVERMIELGSTNEEDIEKLYRALLQVDLIVPLAQDEQRPITLPLDEKQVVPAFTSKDKVDMNLVPEDARFFQMKMEVLSRLALRFQADLIDVNPPEKLFRVNRKMMRRVVADTAPADAAKNKSVVGLPKNRPPSEMLQRIRESAEKNGMKEVSWCVSMSEPGIYSFVIECTPFDNEEFKDAAGAAFNEFSGDEMDLVFFESGKLGIDWSNHELIYQAQA